RPGLAARAALRDRLGVRRTGRLRVRRRAQPPQGAMRVGVDATSWVNRRGYGRFARNALTRLVGLGGDTTYVFVIDEAGALAADLPGERLIVKLSRPPSEAASAESYRSPADLLRLGGAVTRARFDALLFPSVYTYFPSAAVRTVVGVH